MSIADDDPGFESSKSTESIHTSEFLHYAVANVCLPVKAPDDDDYTPEKDLSLARTVCAAAHAYHAVNVPAGAGTLESQWNSVIRMLDNLRVSLQLERLDTDHVVSQLRGMGIGDVLVFPIRPHNSAIILTQRERCMLVESFELFPSNNIAEGTTGSPTCSYPECAIEISRELLNSGDTQIKIANFLSHSDTLASDSSLASDPTLPPVHTQYISTLLSGILQAVGHTVDASRIVKCVRHDVPRSPNRPAGFSWRRSSLWLLIRVAIQMSLDRSPFGRTSYKGFVLFFLSTLATDANTAVLSTNLLHSLGSKIIRRLGKLGSSTAHDWLSQLAVKACAGLRESLDAKWRQLGTRSSPFRNPSQEELTRDTQLSLEQSREYIRDALANHPHEPADTPFHPSHHRRGTIDDFLSSNGSLFDEAYLADRQVTLYDVEHSVEQGIDDWISCVTNVEEACTQLEILMDKYMKSTGCYACPEDRSIMLLTGVELFIALDKLIVKEIPMLSDYSLSIPITWLEKLMLRRTTNLHRLACAYQYLSARYSQSHSALSVLSNDFTKDSFPVRYYDQSLYHQQLKGRIEEDAMVDCDGQHNDQLHLSGRRDASRTNVSRLPLPALPLHAKVVVFELECPPCVRIWRSAVARIWHYACDFNSVFREAKKETEECLLSHAPTLQGYFVDRDATLPLEVQIQFAYVYPGPSQNSPSLRYAIRYPSYDDKKHHLSIWPPQDYENQFSLGHFLYFPQNPLEKYVHDTSHTSNDVLAAQANCPSGPSLDEFIEFGQLRSGGSLQWVNILRGLRSRTLNLRYDTSFVLLAQAAFEVGPLDLSSGTWIWHQELREPSFCNALLDEIETLFMEVGARLIDNIMMGSISLLLIRVLASSPSEGVSERVVALLSRVRRKTFSWVQELLYNLIMAPTNEDRSNFLREMATTCRTTFDVDSTQLSKLCHSAEDVDALISCSLFIRTLPSPTGFGTEYKLPLLSGRDRRLALALEGTLRDIILADVSDYGIDLAVAKTFAVHKPSPYRWEQSHHPDSRWLTCKTKLMGDRPSQTVRLNILNGELRADGHPLSVLPRATTSNYIYKQIFRDQGFFVIPSNLPGMDFTTLTTMSERKVHWAGQGDNLVVRAQSNGSNDILELIPSIKLKEDLPPALVYSCVHWLNLSTQIMEIRPHKRLWDESPENWRIDCASGHYRAYKGHDTLVDIRSPTWAMISKCFRCLNNDLGEWSDDLLVITSPVEPLQSAPGLRLSATLPGYQLSFFVNAEGELESADFKNVVYDENQRVDAFPGLESVLVLRQKTHLAEGLVPRRILIPNGLIKKSGDHQFQVVNDPQRYTVSVQPSYHAYTMDIELGCLVGDGSLISTGYLAYLHAATGCDWYSDPLTEKTSVEAALCLFRSAACRSIMQLKALDISAFWTSSHYPEVKTLLEELQLRYYWDRDTNPGEHVSGLLERRAALRGNAPPSSGFPTGSYTTHLSKEPESAIPPQVTLHQLLSNRPAPQLSLRSTLLRDSRKTSSNNISLLNQLFSSLPIIKSSSSYQQEYIALVQRSARCVHEDSRTTRDSTGNIHMDTLEKHYAECRGKYLLALATLKQTLGPTANPLEQALHRFGQWPPITADVLLRYLASTSPFKLPKQWKKCLISLSLLLLDLQRARRLFLFALDGHEEELWKELENEGCDGWDPEEFPDWLLIQVQGNFLIRRAQAETAREMMSPRSGENTVMQVNMGEGKSSVIIPIVAAALANGKQLVRIIVPKPLTVQMFESLVSRLGGLAHRSIYHLPFSRSPEYNHNGKIISLQVDELQKLMFQCMAERGILLVQPEHVASLKLKSVEKQIHKSQLSADPLPKLQLSIYKHIKMALLGKQLSKDSLVGSMFRSMSSPPEKDNTPGEHYENCGENAQGNSDCVPKWLTFQKWSHSHVRDILDESDETLRPRFQLIYTVGHERHMDGYPERWTITQQVLRLVKECADGLSRIHPNSIEYKCGPPGSFPHIRIVRATDVGQRLMPFVVEDVMAGRLPSVNVRDISDPALHRAIRSFISDKNALQVPDTVRKVEEYAKSVDQSCMWSGLLLLRGLLTSGILLSALTERRWRVDYGLWIGHHRHASTPTKLAVPYRAKDVPAPNTQFGHPDMTIILTCLSYYYGGLNNWQLKTAFEILLNEDDPVTEYALWVKDYDNGLVSDSLRTLNEINLRPSEQWDKVVFPLFSRNQAAIDFYLSRVVFPQEAKEYPLKLTASSWDLAEKQAKPITGFSGTNDGRWLLPMSIAQRDLDYQQGTNARVLAYLLRPENDSYMIINQDFYVTMNKVNERWATPEFLRMVAKQEPKIRILLDVGAQILDFSNEQVAEEWLDIARDAAGAIFFNDSDELLVLMRNGETVPLLSSSLSQTLDRFVVYLDHAHTRGTDLKLPIGSRAAVTLGPKLTKDSLVQGCMRMRKLGHGHSVMFFAPPEVDWSIRALAGKKDLNVRVTTVDIICWAIHETWADIQQQAPYWAQQGMNHKSRYATWAPFCNGDLAPERLSDVWLQQEHKSLEDLYAPCQSKNPSSVLPLDPEIRQRCKDLGILSLSATQMDEEQEREVNREKEREREAQLPPKAEPAEHFLHQDVATFVKTGVIPPLHSGSAFRPVFTTLEKSSATALEADVWSPFILATVDFCNTVKPESTQGTIDQYLRPVQWVLSSKRDCGHLLVLLSPFEVDRLMPDIRVSEYVHLHVYAPRTSKRTKPDDLKLYTIPPLPSDWTPPWDLIDQLNVFSGQLYLRDYPSYLRLCRFLGEPTRELPSDGVPAAVRRPGNLFSVPGSFEENEITFSGSPLSSIMALLAIRSRGRPFAHTHMGKILYGQPLTAKDFEEPWSVMLGGANATHNYQRSYDLASDTTPSSPSDMMAEGDPYHGPGASSLPSSSKRRLETAEIFDADSEPPQKHLRLGR